MECNHCYDACLKEVDMKMVATCIRLDRECADFCNCIINVISRDTPPVSELASVCATIYVACSNECKKHNNEHCQRCAEACLKCAKECRKIA